jgi:hypothetical protein
MTSISRVFDPRGGQPVEKWSGPRRPRDWGMDRTGPCRRMWLREKREKREEQQR